MVRHGRGRGNTRPHPRRGVPGPAVFAMMASTLSATRPRGPARLRAPAITLAWALGAFAGCYNDGYLDGLCARTNTCPVSRVAFHVTSLELVDPHSYSFDEVIGVCDDSTDDFNKLLSDNIGIFNVGHAIVLRPLDLGSERVSLQFTAADCFNDDMTSGSKVCSDRNIEPALSISTTASNYSAAMMSTPDACDVVQVNSLNPDYTAPSQPGLPCMRSEAIPTMTLRLSRQPGMNPLEFELVDVEIAATYAIDKNPQELVQGTLRGFLTTAKAMVPAGQVNGVDFVPWKVLAGGDGCQPDAGDVISDLDIHPTLGQGVWMYFNFTAESVQWDTDVPDGSGGSSGGSATDGATTDGTTSSTTDASSSGSSSGTTGGSSSGTTL